MTSEENNEDITELKWYQRRLRFTGEYCSGIISGLGLGILIIASLMHFKCIQSFNFFVHLAGIVIITIGIEYGRLIQREKLELNSYLKRRELSKRLYEVDHES